MRGIRLTSAFLVCFALIGCSGSKGFSDIDRFMKEVDEKPRGKIKELPTLQVYRAFSYSAAASRSPFLPPQDVALQEIELAPEQDDVKPNFDRPKEVLESFSLNQLGMVGTIQRGPDSELLALISDSDGGVHMVKPGQYLGKNHGRVVALSDSRVDVIEIVPNGHGGWLERPRSISIDEQVN